MNEMDDIFDIEAFLKTKRAPKEIMAAWKRFWKQYNDFETLASEGQRLQHAVNTARRLLLGNSFKE